MVTWVASSRNTVPSEVPSTIVVVGSDGFPMICSEFRVSGTTMCSGYNPGDTCIVSPLEAALTAC